MCNESSEATTKMNTKQLSCWVDAMHDFLSTFNRKDRIFIGLDKNERIIWIQWSNVMMNITTVKRKQCVECFFFSSKRSKPQNIQSRWATEQLDCPKSRIGKQYLSDRLDILHRYYTHTLKHTYIHTHT